jgi:hypothetical protein
MIKDWTARIAAAQQVTACWKNGKEYGRIRYVDEDDD